MTVTFDDARLSEAQMVERVRETGARVKPYGVEVERAPETVREWLVHWTTGERLEVVFTALTFVFMITGWVTARLGVPWHDVFYLGAYLTGGYFGVQAGLQSLRQWTIDVDLLMVLAALGRGGRRRAVRRRDAAFSLLAFQRAAGLRDRPHAQGDQVADEAAPG